MMIAKYEYFLAWLIWCYIQDGSVGYKGIFGSMVIKKGNTTLLIVVMNILKCEVAEQDYLTTIV